MDYLTKNLPFFLLNLLIEIYYSKNYNDIYCFNINIEEKNNIDLNHLKKYFNTVRYVDVFMGKGKTQIEFIGITEKSLNDIENAKNKVNKKHNEYTYFKFYDLLNSHSKIESIKRDDIDVIGFSSHKVIYNNIINDSTNKNNKITDIHDYLIKSLIMRYYATENAEHDSGVCSIGTKLLNYSNTIEDLIIDYFAPFFNNIAVLTIKNKNTEYLDDIILQKISIDVNNSLKETSILDLLTKKELILPSVTDSWLIKS